ncbi:hypothetical protein [Parvularcula maris]|uniref:TonB-dependent receptor plug domain-containing protein n=1 Tax=Parvularcula maris TaxID=2965077 RepID=A0A9X2LAK3_9PROT|nr:hypothetical protein [Parvularcula maris]MCQ8186171.1 hypothetical protein [Parvularcula maris]
MNRHLAFAGAVSLAMLPMISLAQETDADNPQTFEPAFFERFAPQTARDMLFRVPGFSIRDTSEGRGLGQGGANVLINGQRVTAKETDALEILDRTPASSVVRIEIVDAASLGVTGLTGQVANVVIDRSNFSGNWEYNPTFRERLAPRLTNGSVSFSGEAKGVTYTVGFENNSYRAGHWGPELVFDGARRLTEERFEDAWYYGERPSLTVNLSGGKKETALYNFSVKGELFTFDGRETSNQAENLTRVSSNSEDEWNAEVSGDVTRKIGPGDAKLIGYHRFEHSPFVNELKLVQEPSPLVIDRFFQDADETETIGRFEYTVPRPDDRSWEFAAEYAYNRLDTDSASETNETGPFVRTLLDSVAVEEDRVQGSVTYSRKMFGDLSVQTSLGAEYSELQSDTDGVEGEVRSFFRPKGFLTFAYPTGAKSDFRARLERSVGQLNFFDFVSSQNLQEGINSAGNTSLVPQQSWDGEVEFERRFGPEEKIILRAEASLIEDRVDNIVIDGQEAVGNIDEARRLSIETEGTFLFERFGIKGMRTDFHAERRFTKLEDPLTGEDRPFSGHIRWRARASLRHDVPGTQIAYGFFTSHIEFEDRLSARVQSLESFSLPQTEVFLQHKDFFGLNATFTVTNLFDQEERFDRTVYTGLRSESPIAFIEERARVYGPIYSLSIAGTF